MIIPWEPGGGLGNRLFISAYAISLAKASGQRCFNLQLGEFEDLFPATKPLVLRGRTRTFVYRVLVALVRRLKRLPPARPFFITFSTDGKNSPHYSPGNPAFIAEVQGRWFTLVNGWPFIEFMTFPHSETIREIFTPRAEVLAEAENAARRAKGDADVLVGMHIRQGDVRKTFGGRYYYPSELYAELMRNVERALQPRRVAFMICSNEVQDPALFKPMQISMGPGTLLGDLYGFSYCDYIIGPPSTFSLWGAFYGRKNILFMHHPTTEVNLSDFMIPDGHFELCQTSIDSS